jgi:hypothetical protein
MAGILFGIALILWGSQIFLSNAFGVHIPLFQYAAALFLIYCGFSLLFPEQTARYYKHSIYSNKNETIIIDHNSPHFFKVRFGSFIFDNQFFNRTMGPKKIKIDGSLCNISIKTNPNIHTIVYFKGTFSSVNDLNKPLPNDIGEKRFLHFGPTHEPVMLEYHIRVKFGSLEFI